MKHRISFYLKCLFVFLASALFCAPAVTAKTCSTFEEGLVKIPSVRVGSAFLKVQLQPLGGDVFRVFDYVESQDKTAVATVVTEAGVTKLMIPCINLHGNRTWWAELKLLPGENNDFELLSAGENTGDLLINEIVAKAADDGNDWIELYAAGFQPVNLGLYAIVDENAEHQRVNLPSVILNPGGFYLIQAVNETEPPSDGSFYIPYKLSKGDAVVLFRGDRVVDAFDWKDGDSPEGKSYGRLPDGAGIPQTLFPTPGAANVGD